MTNARCFSVARQQKLINLFSSNLSSTEMTSLNKKSRARVPRKTWRLIVFMVFWLLVGMFIGFVVSSLAIRTDPASALEFLSATAQIGATIFGIFSAAILFLMESPRKKIRVIMSKEFFVLSFCLFGAAILSSLIAMLTISQDKSVALSSVAFPFYMMTAGIIALGIFIWDLYAKTA